MLTGRFRNKRRARKEREMEYADNFEHLKAENAKRFHANMQTHDDNNIDERGNAEQINGYERREMEQNRTALPSYDDILRIKSNDTRQVEHSVDDLRQSEGDMGNGTGRERGRPTERR